MALILVRKSLVKQQILMYKTAVYRPVNGGITHQKQQISAKGDDAVIHRLSVNVLLSNITFSPLTIAYKLRFCTVHLYLLFH